MFVVISAIYSDKYKAYC